MPSEYEIPQNLDSNVGSSAPTGMDALFQSSGILGAVYQRVSRLLQPNLMLGVTTSATSTSKIAPALINATSTGGEYALNVSTSDGGKLAASAPTFATAGASAKIVTGSDAQRQVWICNTDSTDSISLAFTTVGGSVTAVANRGIVLGPKGSCIITGFRGDVYAVANANTPNIAIQVFTG